MPVIAQIAPGTSAGLAALLFLLLPGIVFVKAVMIASRRIADLSRFDQLGYVLAGGVGSLVFVVGGRRLLGGTRLTLDAVFTRSVTVLLTGVVVQSVVAVIIGYSWGRFLRAGSDIEPSRTWDDRDQP